MNYTSPLTTLRFFLLWNPIRFFQKIEYVSLRFPAKKSLLPASTNFLPWYPFEGRFIDRFLRFLSRTNPTRFLLMKWFAFTIFFAYFQTLILILCLFSLFLYFMIRFYDKILWILRSRSFYTERIYVCVYTCYIQVLC